MKIYTKAGDKGTTKLVDGNCVEKFNPRVEAYGTVDELNSYLGLIYSLLEKTSPLKIGEKTLNHRIFEILNQLFIVGSLLATKDSSVMAKLPQLSPEDTLDLENDIDIMTAQLEPLRNFILPTGHEISSHFHVARTICRRSERRAAEVAGSETPYSEVLIYLNRLSDFLFTAARFVNHCHQKPDVLWKKK